jgi:putative SOS response-associated peptidase YedK
MTVLYALDANAAVIGGAFGVDAGADPWAGGHVAPGQFAPVVTAGREAVAGPRVERSPLRLVPRLWGVPPPGSVADPGRAVLTVRNPDSPFWIGNLRNSEFRCLVPATAVFAWGRVDPTTNRRRRHWLGCAEQPLFAMAAVWKDSEVPSFALMTCEANAAYRALGQERMPVIMPDSAHARGEWLRGGWDKAARWLEPYPGSAMRER